MLWAGSAGSLPALKILLEAGADVNAHDFDGLTSLHCAASRGHTDCLKVLLAQAAIEVDATDTNGCSSLFYSVTLGHSECTEELIKAGALVNRQDMKGRTPAHCAAAKGLYNSVKTLEKHGADLWIRNSRGDYPIHEAIHSGRKDLISWLLNVNPESVNFTNDEGRTLLHIAALYDKIEICKVLMDQGAFVNSIMRNSKGQLLTPFDAAMHRSNRGCAKYLQLHGGVPAAKITDKNALQRALVRAFSETKGEKSLPTIDTSDQEKRSVDQPTLETVGNQTSTVQLENKDIQSIAETKDSSSQMIFEFDDKESQTSPQKENTVESKMSPTNELSETASTNEVEEPKEDISKDGSTSYEYNESIHWIVG